MAGTGMSIVVGIFAVLGAAIAVAGVGSLYAGLKIRSADEDAVTDAAAGGPVDLEGQARPHEDVLEAPFSGRECLGYEYKVEEYEHRRTGNTAGSSGGWKSKDTGGTTVPFLLESDDGTVLVRDGEGASLDIGDDRERIKVPGGSEPPRQVREFIESNDSVTSENRSVDLKVTEVSYGDRRRYTEHVLLPGETTYVSGVARPPSSAPGEVPREASAVVGPPETDGLVDRLRHRLWPLTFLISDAPMAEAAKRQIKKGVVFAVVGSVFAVGMGYVVFAG